MHFFSSNPLERRRAVVVGICKKKKEKKLSKRFFPYQDFEEDRETSTQ